MKKSVKFLAVLIFFTVFAGPSFSADLPWGNKMYKKKNIITVIVARNSFKSQTLAELIQFRTNQPILLYSGDGDLFFYGPDKKKMLKIKKQDVSDFIAFVHPKYMLVLGSDKHVPSGLVRKINPIKKKYVLSDKNWNKIAWRAEEIMGLSGLATEFAKKMKALEDGRIIPKKGSAPIKRNEPKVVLPK